VRVRKCVRRFGMRVLRTLNQCAESRLRRMPLLGMPFLELASVTVKGDSGRCVHSP
jgi:hypothetical protein